MNETTSAGWYTDSTNEHLVRYWTGAEWTVERVWNGQGWTDTSVSARSASNPAAAVLGWTKTFRAMCVGAAAVTLGSFLPWAEVRSFYGSVSVRPDGSAAFIFLTLAAGALFFAAATKDGRRLSAGRRVGLVSCVGLLTLFLCTNWSGISDVQDKTDAVSVGIGLFVFGGGVITLIVGTIKTFVSKPSQGL